MATLCASGPHAIPVSTAVRSGDAEILFALARSRDTLARLRRDPACALMIVDRGVAFTAIGTARIVRDEMDATERVAALALVVEEVQDHLADQRTLIRSGAAWEWVSDDDAQRDATIRRELQALAAR